MLKTNFSILKSSPETLQKTQAALAALRLRSDLGFMQLPLGLDQIQARANEIREKFSHVVVLGIGGSALGIRAIFEALEISDPKIKISIIDNVDSYSFFKTLDGLDLQHCHFLMISKSGQTIETLTQAEFVEQALVQKKLPGLAKVSTVVSEFEKNPLTEWAEKSHVPVLEIPKNVGGRFSVLTPVGLLPAAIAGLDLKKFQEGANWAKKQDQLITELSAQALMSFERGEWVTLFWSYCDRLLSFGFWLQQLWAESLAKSNDRTGQKAMRASTPLPCKGSTDQHSILQQIMEGERDKFIYFFRCHESENSGPKIETTLFRGQEMMNNKTMGELYTAQATAIRESLAEAKVYSTTCQVEKLNEASVGALFMLFQLVIGTLGEVMNIDAYNQPGVEAGKIATKKLLSQK